MASVVPAPVPTAMDRPDLDIELLASEIWPTLTGEWKTNAPVPIPGMPCGTATSEYTYGPLSDGAYPFEGTTVITCCGCCRVKEKTTGQVSGDGTSISATSRNGFQSHGTLAAMDAKSNKVTYQWTGSSAQGPISGTSVVEPTTWTDTIHTNGRTLVFVFSKVCS